MTTNDRANIKYTFFLFKLRCPTAGHSFDRHKFISVTQARYVFIVEILSKSTSYNTCFRVLLMLIRIIIVLIYILIALNVYKHWFGSLDRSLRDRKSIWCFERGNKLSKQLSVDAVAHRGKEIIDLFIFPEG